MFNAHTAPPSPLPYAGTVKCEHCQRDGEFCSARGVADSELGYFCGRHIRLAREVGLTLIPLPVAPEYFWVMWGIADRA